MKKQMRGVEEKTLEEIKSKSDRKIYMGECRSFQKKSHIHKHYNRHQTHTRNAKIRNRMRGKFRKSRRK